MKTNIKIAIMVWVVIYMCGMAGAEELKTYKSPNGKLIAHVISINGESIIEIITKSGDKLISKDYTSADGEHGLAIENIKWTPDSKFLIYTTYSSGGHQPWAYPSYFYNVKDNSFLCFCDYFPAVAESTIKVTKPDIVTISIWTPLSENKSVDESIVLPITFHMADLLKPKGLR